jgi:hypothetical protein
VNRRFRPDGLVKIDRSHGSSLPDVHRTRTVFTGCCFGASKGPLWILTRFGTGVRTSVDV